MFIVLMERVLKFIGMLVYFLSPKFLFFISKYPTFHIFSFYYKNTILRYNNMINLSSSFFSRKSNIFDEMILIFIEFKFCGSVYKKFSNNTFAPRCSKKCYNDNNR